MALSGLLLLLLAPSYAGAAELPNVYALTNARIVTSPGKVIEKGTLVVRAGTIQAVGAAGTVSIPADAQVLDLSGKSVYAGLIDSYVTLSRLAGRKDSPAEGDDDAATRRRRALAASATPAAEPAGNVHPLPRIHPELRAAAELKITPDVREAFRDLGFTVVGAVPDHGVLRGRSAVASLGDGPVAKALISARWAQHVAPDLDRGDGGDEYPASKMGVVAAVRQAFLDARFSQAAEAAWAAKPGLPRPERIEAFAALADAAAGKETVVFEAPDALALLRAGRIAAELNLKALYVGAPDAYVLMDEVKAMQPGLILTLNFPATPSVEDEDDWTDVSLKRLRAWDRAASNPRWLRDAGVTFALTTHGLAEPADLTDRVKKARARGLSEDDVLAAFTTVPAKLLGLSDRLGDLAPGKAANLVVASGALFTDKGRVTQTWVDGVPYDVKPKRATLPATYRVDGTRVDLRADARTGLLGVRVTPAGGRAVTASSVVRHGSIVTFEIDGAAFGLPAGTVPATAVLEGSTLRLELRPPAGERVVKSGEKEARPAGRPGAAADEGAEARTAEAVDAADAPDSDVRPLPGRFAVPLAAPRAVLVKNATVWTSGPKGTLEKAGLLVVDGKVQAVGTGLAVPAALAASAVEIDAEGRAVTPGLIDCHSHTAIDGGVNEGTHNITSEVRIADVIDPFSPAIYRELAGGLTAAHVLHGSANAIGGQDDLIKLKWGEGPQGLHFVDAVPGIKFALGENPKRSSSPVPGIRYPQTRMGVGASIRERFLAARDYRRKQKEFEAAKKRGENPAPVRADLQLEAIAEILEGKRLIHAHGYVKQELLDLLRVSEEFGVKVATLQHVLEGYKIADEMAAHGAGGSSFSDWWAYKFEVYDAIPYNGALMRERGVLVTFNSDSDELARRMNVEAAKAVKYGGVPREEALKFVTWNAAKQLHVEKRLGSLEPGKDGDFVIWSGDPLDPASMCLETWIEGKKYFDRTLDVKQRAGLAAEKSDLIARARTAAARGGPTAGPETDRRRPGGCLDEADHDDRSGAGTEVTR